MKKSINLFRQLNPHPEPFVEWPFLLILTFAFGFVYVQSLMQQPALREPARMVPFTVLISVHIIFHWLSVRLLNWKQLSIYLVIQGALAFIITYLSGNIALLIALYMGLIGGTVGLLREKPRWAIGSVTIFLALSFINYVLLIGKTTWYWWFLVMGPVTLFVIVYVTMYSSQSEARARAQRLLKELEAANHQLSEYAAQVEDLTLANERQRMARELHDTLSQGLAGLILQLEAVDAHMAGNNPKKAGMILRESMDRARETLAEARLAIDDLRHDTRRNLEQAVRQEIDEFMESTGIPCSQEIEFPTNISEQVSETIMRVTIEGLTNISRHANAGKAGIKMVTNPGEDKLEIEISDDGIGFDPEKVEGGHYGLLGMRERVRLAGGNLDVRSQPGNGTRILIQIPIRMSANATVFGGGSKIN